MDQLSTSHPFGTIIDENALRDIFIPLKSWEDKYRALIQLSKKLPSLPENLKYESNEISGCENRVWLDGTLLTDGRMHFYGDSEGRIVRGLLAILLTAVEGKTPQQLATLDIERLYHDLGLSHQLSASRTNGLKAMILRTKMTANQAD